MIRTGHKTEGKFIEPLSDSGFKILFGRESSADILMGFLNAVLERDASDPITEIYYKDKEKVMESAEERSIAYDIASRRSGTPTGS